MANREKYYGLYYLLGIYICKMITLPTNHLRFHEKPGPTWPYLFTINCYFCWCGQLYSNYNIVISAYHSKPLLIWTPYNFLHIITPYAWTAYVSQMQCFSLPKHPMILPKAILGPTLSLHLHCPLHTKRPPISKSPAPMLLSIWSPFSIFPCLNVTLVLWTPRSNSSSTCTDSTMSLIPCGPMFLLFFSTSY